MTITIDLLYASYYLDERNWQKPFMEDYGAGEGTQTPSLLITSQLRYQLRHAGRERKEFGEQFQSHAIPMDFTALFRQQVGRSTAGRHGVGPPSVPYWEFLLS